MSAAFRNDFFRIPTAALKKFPPDGAVCDDCPSAPDKAYDPKLNHRNAGDINSGSWLCLCCGQETVKKHNATRLEAIPTDK